MRFEDLELAPELMRGLEDVGFVDCTAIQELALPYSLDGEDIAGQAQTGTGKTACFLLTAFERLLESDVAPRPGQPRAICIAPTRELAVQIADDAEVLARHTDLKISTIYGGVSFDKQRRDLRGGIDLMIGTPGRVIDYLRRGEMKLDDCRIAVIDEADRMFDMGFIKDLRYIMRKLPPKNSRQTMLFSATLNFTVMELAYEFMNRPREIAVEPEHIVVDQIEQVLYHVGAHEKFQLLLGLIHKHEPKRAIVFCNRKVVVERIAHRLNGNGIDCAAIIGDMQQSSRLKVIERFKAGDLRVLIATDVASRGLHVDNVSHVFNYDVPQDPEDYVHRIGRTGRMGAAGNAVTLACEEYVLHLPPVEHYVGYKIAVGTLSDDLFAIDDSPPPPRRSYGRGRFGGRGGVRPGGGGRGGGGRGGGGGGGQRGRRNRSRR